MKVLYSLSILFLLLAVFFSHAAISGEEMQTFLCPDNNPACPEYIFSRVAEAWRSGRVAPVEEYLSRNGIHFSLSMDYPYHGYYSSNQALFILDDLLRGSETTRFEFVRFSNLEGGGGSPTGAAERAYRSGVNDEKEEMVFISLTMDEGRWAIHQIKTTPRL